MASRTSFFQETFFGLLAHAFAPGKGLLYREEQPDFEVPENYEPGYKTRTGGAPFHHQHDGSSYSEKHADAQTYAASDEEEAAAVAAEDDEHLSPLPSKPRRKPPPRRASSGLSVQSYHSARSSLSNHSSNSGESGATAVGNANSKKDGSVPPSRSASDSAEPLEGPPTSLETCNTDPYLVDWRGETDTDNPQQWSFAKKCGVTFLICLLTTSVYLASAIYTPGIPLVAEYFGVGEVTATLGLTLFVFAYGLGPMIGLTSMSEIPAIGRTFPYLVTLAIFVILQVPTALVNNIAGFMILRFLAGIVGSPPLATGGATLADIWSPKKQSLAIGIWGLSAVMAPACAPLISGFAIQGIEGIEAWRWTIWPVLFLSGFTLVVLAFFLPETGANNILVRRAKRLRKRTGNPHLRSKGEIIAAGLTGKEIALMTFVRPFRLGLGEPILLAINLHIGLVYGILYLWFEAFPIVFQQVHGFSTGTGGLAYLGVLVAAVLGWCLFAIWHVYRYERIFEKTGGKVAPELWLEPAMLGAWCIPICMFFFGWTSTASIHWIAPIIASGFFSLGTFSIFQSGLSYCASAYPDYIASVYSANDFFRASIGAALPLVARAMFSNLQANGPAAFPVAWGSTLIGCIALVMAPIPIVLHRFGPKLRAWSKYSTSPSDEPKST